MTDTLVRAIVHVDEERLPILWYGVVVDRIAMVLRSDEALFGRLAVLHQAHRLVVTSVSVFEFLDLGSCGKRENLVCPCRCHR